MIINTTYCFKIVFLKNYYIIMNKIIQVMFLALSLLFIFYYFINLYINIIIYSVLIIELMSSRFQNLFLAKIIIKQLRLT